MARAVSVAASKNATELSVAELTFKPVARRSCVRLIASVVLCSANKFVADAADKLMAVPIERFLRFRVSAMYPAPFWSGPVRNVHSERTSHLGVFIPELIQKFKG